MFGLEVGSLVLFLFIGLYRMMGLEFLIFLEKRKILI